MLLPVTALSKDKLPQAGLNAGTHIPHQQSLLLPCSEGEAPEVPIPTQAALSAGCQDESLSLLLFSMRETEAVSELMQQETLGSTPHSQHILQL